MKLAYKGFDSNLKCKNEQFTVGGIYSKNVELKTPRLCTSDGYHYCNSLEDVFTYYPNNENNRFCEIQILGAFTDDRDKSITTSFKIIREITKRELLEKTLEKDEKRIVSNLNLDVVREIQEKYPMFHVGGSVGLFLHGARLRRWTNNSGSDLDMVSPYFVLVEDTEDPDNVIQLDSKASGNDFDETFLYSGVKVDLRIDPKQRYEYIEYDGFKYKVSPLFTILQAKMKYANNNQAKHKKDLLELFTAGFVTPAKKQNNTDTDFTF